MKKIKREDILAFLDTEDAADMTTQQVADHLGCGVTAVKEAKVFHKALAAMVRTAPPEDATQDEAKDALYLDMLRADEAEQELEALLKETKQTVTDIKTTLAETVDHRRSLGREARENHPLFDNLPGGEKIRYEGGEPDGGLAIETADTIRMVKTG